MEETRMCPECGTKLFHNKGVSKAKGIPYENWNCPKCDFIEWIDINKEAAKQMNMSSELKPSTKLSDFLIKVEQIGEEAKRIREKLK